LEHRISKTSGSPGIRTFCNVRGKLMAVIKAPEGTLNDSYN